MKSRLGVAAAIAITIMAVSAAALAADTSGPNSSGYTWDDGVPFDYVDISGTGTDLGFGDDDSDVVPLPFTFEYFGQPYSEVLISSNGFLSFDTDDPNDCGENYNWDDTLASQSPNGDDPGFPIPWGDEDCDTDGWGPNPLIAVWFTDHDQGECGAAYYETIGNQFIVQWNTCNNNDPSGDIGCDVNFEVILFEGSNEILFQYEDTSFSCEETHYEDDGEYATVGLNEDDSRGLQYSWNEPALSDGLAILWSPGSFAGPTPEPTDCIPGIPGSRCGEDDGGGGGGGNTPVATNTPENTPIPVATATLAPPPVVPTAPGGGSGGVITAPDTGSGPLADGASAPAFAMWLLAAAAVAAGAGALALRRR